MNTNYEPKGRAREYSPLALNIYAACDHGCDYCYARRFWGKEVKPREGLLPALRKWLEKNGAPNKQVLLSFLSDPYCRADIEHKATRQVLELLLKYQVPVSILTKGGHRAGRDFDLFRQFRRFSLGATLTYGLSETSAAHEPSAALPRDRIGMLGRAKDAGLKTWISFEPLVDLDAVKGIMRMLAGFVDHYKLGPLNHVAGTPWPQKAMEELISRARETGVPLYLKSGFEDHFPPDFFLPGERDAARFEV